MGYFLYDFWREECYSKVNRLFDIQEYWSEKKNKFFAKSNIASRILESDEIICATKACGIDRFTLSNWEKAITYGKILGDSNTTINTYV